MSLIKKDIKYAIIFLTILFSSLLSDVLLKIHVHENDIFDLVVKITNFLLFYCLIPKEKITINDFKGFYNNIYILGIISGIYNFIKNFKIISSFLNISNSYSVNISSFFSNRNTYGMFLFVCIICGIYLISINKDRKKIYIVGTLFLFVNMIFTMSRGSLLSTVIFIVIYYLMKNRDRKNAYLFTIMIIVLLSCCVVYVYLHPNIYEIIQKLFIRKEVGNTGRTNLWAIGFNIAISNNILTGVGFYSGLALTSGFPQFHSFFIDTIVDCGLIGLLFKIFILINLYLSIRKINNNEYKELKIIYESAYYALLFLSIFESVNFFSLGFAEIQFTLLFITIPKILKTQNYYCCLNNKD